MKITVHGVGYVGLVQGAMFADVGCNVLCFDIDPEKIKQISAGNIPFYEPGLGELVKNGIESGRLAFSSNIEEAVEFGYFQFIAVGTPSDENGSADLSYVLSVAKNIASFMTDEKIIINKSTVPVGTADKVSDTVSSVLAERKCSINFHVCSNPEFLKEGSAISDCQRPDRIIIGTESELVAKAMKELYAPFNRNHDRMMIMSTRSAELTKYAANCMLATKISFVNELANLAEDIGANFDEVRLGMGADARIGYHFIYPGCGYGGSCFPKDIRALRHTAQQNGHTLKILEAVEDVNRAQKKVLFNKINQHFKADLNDKVFALWGLAFKPNTDDMREAPSRVLMEALWQAGARIQAYDPKAMHECERLYGNRDDLLLVATQMEALKNADALIICTEWKSFKSPNFSEIKKLLKQPVIFDGRNLYDPVVMSEFGVQYYGIGLRN